MAVTPSNMLPLETIAPDFSLPDAVSGKILTLTNLKSDTATVIMFICNHCPFVKYILATLVATAANYKQLGIRFIAINSNDVDSYPADSPEKMHELAKEFNFSFPYLYDESQQIAKNYAAACTPDFYIFDQQLKLVYRGRFDDATPGNRIAVTGNDLRAALDNILDNKPVSENQRASIGCNIKWKPNG